MERDKNPYYKVAIPKQHLHTFVSNMSNCVYDWGGKKVTPELYYLQQWSKINTQELLPKQHLNLFPCVLWGSPEFKSQPNFIWIMGGILSRINNWIFCVCVETSPKNIRYCMRKCSMTGSTSPNHHFVPNSSVPSHHFEQIAPKDLAKESSFQKPNNGPHLF